jgi:endonuclease/exonuclease/phosphatase family metal-dependent hydrolase
VFSYRRVELRAARPLLAFSSLARAGLPQGHPYKAIDHAFSTHVADSDILAATKFGVPIGGFGHCAASDHLGLKVTIRTQ